VKKQTHRHVSLAFVKGPAIYECLTKKDACMKQDNKMIIEATLSPV